MMLSTYTMKHLLLLAVLLVSAGLLLVNVDRVRDLKLAISKGQAYSLQRRQTELESAHQETRLLLNKLYCSNGRALPSGGYCLNKDNILIGSNFLWSAKLCALLEELFGNATVGDFGAGLGHYGRCFLRRSESIVSSGNPKEIQGIDRTYRDRMTRAKLLGKPQVIRSWHGWDGAANIDDVSHGRILSLDLSKPVDVGRRFDWVMSLEVGEHIPATGEQPFLDNLVRHACIGVVVSWAVPRQPGHHHVNCRPNAYITDQMVQRGMEPDTEAKDRLRAMVDMPHFRNTLMVFRFPKKRC